MVNFFSSLTLVLGIGTCDNTLDYCPEPVGKAALELGIAEYQRHSIMFEAVHYSKVGDGEPSKGDRGTEFYILEYKYRLF